MKLHEPAFIKVKAPSGSGKTTLVHTIWNLRTDYEGRVLYNNVPVEKIEMEEMATVRQQKLSIVFQDLRLFQQLSARENLQLKSSIHASGFGSDDRIEAMAEQLQVQHILEQPAYKCSYGEQQRLAVIRALLQPFVWLIMDEPFSHLDEENTRRAAALIADECKKRNAGFLLTDLDEDDFFAYDHKLNL